MAENPMGVTGASDSAVAETPNLYELQWWITSAGIVSADLSGESVLTGLTPRTGEEVKAFVRTGDFAADQRMRICLLNTGVDHAPVLCRPRDILAWPLARQVLPTSNGLVEVPTSPEANRLAVKQAMRDALDLGRSLDVLNPGAVVALSNHLERTIEDSRTKSRKGSE